MTILLSAFAILVSFISIVMQWLSGKKTTVLSIQRELITMASSFARQANDAWHMSRNSGKTPAASITAAPTMKLHVERNRANI